jgi:hypothetical protein
MEPQQTRRPTREEGLAIASAKKAALRRRTARLRKTVAVVAVCAFVGPFGLIYARMAAGKDPALATTQASATKVSSSLSQGTASATASAKRDAAAAAKRRAAATSTGATSSGSTTSGSTASGSTTASPATVTTQQS